ncbi:contractile injection system protein, VgrG/Pvc8 family, partial [Phyllobacterium leguminum]
MPMLHRLDHGSDSRIFQNVSVPDIIRTVLKECGV